MADAHLSDKTIVINLVHTFLYCSITLNWIFAISHCKPDSQIFQFLPAKTHNVYLKS